jgi:methionine synthase I (cobalamin-dependent)
MRAAAPGARLGAYPARASEASDRDFSERLAAIALERDLAVVGSCCGSTPRTTAALREALSPPSP